MYSISFVYKQKIKTKLLCYIRTIRAFTETCQDHILLYICVSMIEFQIELFQFNDLKITDKVKRVHFYFNVSFQ